MSKNMRTVVERYEQVSGLINRDWFLKPADDDNEPKVILGFGDSCFGPAMTTDDLDSFIDFAVGVRDEMCRRAAEMDP